MSLECGFDKLLGLYARTDHFALSVYDILIGLLNYVKNNK